MAISWTHYSILKELRDAGTLPQRCRILAIGKANWYGDFSFQEILNELKGRRRPEIPEILQRQGCDDAFWVAGLIYEVLFGQSEITSIDLDAHAGAVRRDLNVETEWSLYCDDKYDVSINHGTAEHIFNIANVFICMHQATAIGGLMIHEAPFTGWIDHGFYCLQPTLFWDLAHANNYKIEFVGVEHLASQTYFRVSTREDLLEMRRRSQLPDNAMLFVVFRKIDGAAFRFPLQGVYAGTISEHAAMAWRELR